MRQLVLVLIVALLAVQSAAAAPGHPWQHRPRPTPISARSQPQPGTQSQALDSGGDASLTGSAGEVRLLVSGTMIGSVGPGRIEINSLRPLPRITVTGGSCINIARSTIVCSGSDLSFTVLGGTFRAQIAGENIHASIVGHGLVGTRGVGSSVVNGGPAVSWAPRGFKTFTL